MPFDPDAYLATTAQSTGGFDPDAYLESNTDISTVGNIGSGLNEGIAGTLGLPVDAVTSAVNQTITNLGGEFQINDPVGGAKFFQEVLTNLGMIGDQPQTETGRVIRRGAKEVGSALLPGAGLATKAQAPAKFLAGEIGLAATGGVAAGVVKESGGGVGSQLAAQVLAPLSVSGAAALAKSAARKVVRGGEKGRKTVEDTIKTFKDAGDSPTVGQATQKRNIQNLETLSSKAPGGGKPFFDKATKTVENIQRRVNKISDDLSKSADPEKAGRAIKGAIGSFVDDFKGKASLLYNKLDAKIPQEKKVSVSNTKNLLDDIAAPVKGAEATTTRLVNPIIRQMQKDLSKDAKDGSLPYGALKAIRSRIGEKLSSGDLISDVPKAQLKRLYGSISEDMKKASDEVGASQQWKRADNYWKAGLSRVDDFLEPLAKKAAPEDIFSAATKGREGATKIRSVMKSLNSRERDTVAAAVLKRMGKAKPGSQNELSEAFSTETFLTNWATLSPQARSALFSGTAKLKKYSKDIEQIAKTARIIREGSKALANPSGTSSQLANIFTAGAAAGGVVAPKLLALAGTVFVSNNALARLMTSQTFVKFLADSTRFPVERLPNLVARLGVEIKKEDVQLQMDVQEYLTNLEVKK